MAELTPDLVPWALEAMESKVLIKQEGLPRAKVTKANLRGAEHFSAPLDWTDVYEKDAKEIDVQSVVLLLSDMVGDPERSPFWLSIASTACPHQQMFLKA